MEDHSGKLNGYRPRSYGDIVAIAMLLTMFVSVVAWGLKLEGELNAVRNQQMLILQQVGNGILPRAEERIDALHERIKHLENDE